MKTPLLRSMEAVTEHRLCVCCACSATPHPRKVLHRLSDAEQEYFIVDAREVLQKEKT